MIIDTIEAFFSFIADEVSSEDRTTPLYRGVCKCSYSLTPSVGRLQNNIGQCLTVADEKMILKLFKQKSHGEIKEHLHNDLALLSIAQHHGLPTRLLDWSRNILVAIYFAVKDEVKEEDSLVYVYRPQDMVDLDEEYCPFSIEDVKRYIPKYWSDRIIAQAGVFTVHNDPCTPYNSGNIEQVVIANKVRRKIKKVLSRMGIHQAAMFPDLDGISTHVKWLRTNQY